MDFIKNLLKIVDDKIERINTVELAIVDAVYPEKMRCDVTLKTYLDGIPTKLYHVPIMCNYLGGSTIIVLPEKNDTVIIGYTKRSLTEQVINRGYQTAVNEGVKFNINNAIIMGSLYTEVEEKPAIKSKELLIQHVTGTQIRIKQDGKLLIKCNDDRTRILMENGKIILNSPEKLILNAGHIELCANRVDVDYQKESLNAAMPDKE